MGWIIERVVSDAQSFHDRVLDAPPQRALWIPAIERSALVLGSTQSTALVDAVAAEALGIAVVRRRSGGGAVLVVPGETLWVDVIVPAGDRLWEADVAIAFHWLGRAWMNALSSIGIDGLRVHTGPMITTELSSLVCFSGIGPGEVLAGDRKVVGISQRRTRHGARFQCAVYSRFDAAALAATLAPHPPLDALAASVFTLDDRASLEALEQAIIESVNQY